MSSGIKPELRKHVQGTQGLQRVQEAAQRVNGNEQGTGGAGLGEAEPNEAKEEPGGRVEEVLVGARGCSAPGEAAGWLGERRGEDQSSQVRSCVVPWAGHQLCQSNPACSRLARDPSASKCHGSPDVPNLALLLCVAREPLPSWGGMLRHALGWLPWPCCALGCPGPMGGLPGSKRRG